MGKVWVETKGLIEGIDKFLDYCDFHKATFEEYQHQAYLLAEAIRSINYDLCLLETMIKTPWQLQQRAVHQKYFLQKADDGRVLIDDKKANEYQYSFDAVDALLNQARIRVSHLERTLQDLRDGDDLEEVPYTTHMDELPTTYKQKREVDNVAVGIWVFAGFFILIAFVIIVINGG